MKRMAFVLFGGVLFFTWSYAYAVSPLPFNKSSWFLPRAVTRASVAVTPQAEAPMVKAAQVGPGYMPQGQVGPGYAPQGQVGPGYMPQGQIGPGY
jgi:hypothetical protein